MAGIDLDLELRQGRYAVLTHDYIVLSAWRGAFSAVSKLVSLVSYIISGHGTQHLSRRQVCIVDQA